MTTAPCLPAGALPHGIDVTAAERLDRGWQVTAYRAGAWVIRVPNSTASHASIERQTRLYRALVACGLPVPRDAEVVYDADARVLAGIYRHVAGEPATDGRRTAGLAADLGAFLTALHRVPLERVRDCCETVKDLWAERFEPRWERCRPHLAAHEAAWMAGVIARFVEGRGLDGAALAPVHGDLAEEHVIVGDDGRLAGVIDFSGPRIADAALDFGAVLERFGGPFADAVLGAYDGTVDPGFRRRAEFYADVRPLSTMALGLMAGSAERTRSGRERLAARMASPARTRA